MALMMFYRSPAISGDDAHGHDKFQDLFLKSNLVFVFCAWRERTKQSYTQRQLFFISCILFSSLVLFASFPLQPGWGQTQLTWAPLLSATCFIHFICINYVIYPLRTTALLANAHYEITIYTHEPAADLSKNHSTQTPQNLHSSRWQLSALFGEMHI